MTKQEQLLTLQKIINICSHFSVLESFLQMEIDFNEIGETFYEGNIEDDIVKIFQELEQYIVYGTVIEEEIKNEGQ